MNKKYQGYLMDCKALGIAPLTYNTWVALYENDEPIGSAEGFAYRTGLTPSVRCEHGLVSWQCTLESGKTLYAPTLERLFGLWLKA